MQDKRVASRTLKERSNEAKNLITSLLSSGLKMGEIAERSHVSTRTIYRWLNENHTPHPMLLDALRRMLEQGESK
jgi:DNA invertase Pin-like site-specific DNA recombinase